MFKVFTISVLFVFAGAQAGEREQNAFLIKMAFMHQSNSIPLTLASVQKDGRVEFAKNIGSVTLLESGKYQYTFEKEMPNVNYRVQVYADIFDGMAPKVTEATTKGFVFEFNIWGREKAIKTKHTVWVYLND